MQAKDQSLRVADRCCRWPVAIDFSMFCHCCIVEITDSLLCFHLPKKRSHVKLGDASHGTRVLRICRAATASSRSRCPRGDTSKSDLNPKPCELQFYLSSMFHGRDDATKRFLALGTLDFWAVGTDCCGTTGAPLLGTVGAVRAKICTNCWRPTFRFQCHDATSPFARSGLRIVEDNHKAVRMSFG